MSLILDGTNGLSDIDGSAATPAIRGTDSNTGIFFPAADTIAFSEGGAESMRLDSSGNVGIGTSSPATRLTAKGSTGIAAERDVDTDRMIVTYNNITSYANATGANNYNNWTFTQSNNSGSNERMRIDSIGRFLVGCTTEPNNTVNGFKTASDYTIMSSFQQTVLYVNRNGNDGELVQFRQDNSAEGNISVSGSTVSYNGGHLSRWSQLPNQQKDDTLLKGTVMSNLDDMCVWIKDGQELLNEQLNKMKVSDVEGDINVAGVFVSWQFDEQCQSDDMNVAMTGDMIIRIANGVVVQKGDLLMSAGDGTAKPQGDDIRRSKTIAKVTSNHVTCTYEDGSYCVPCVLMAC